MTMVENIFTASEYLALWRETEELIALEYKKLAGVSKLDNGDDTIEFEDRIAKLRETADYYKHKYQEAYKNENGQKKPYRLKTFNNGL